MVDLNFYIQAAIAMVMITAPPDPAKVLLFNSTIERQGRARTASAVFVAVVVFVILAGATLFGRGLLTAMGINLDAFSVVGGLIIFLMGIEMLYGGNPSRAQGGTVRQEEGADEDEGLIIPLSTPLVAGPGAIVTAITISSYSTSLDATFAGLIGAAVVGLIAFASYEWLGGLVSRLSATATRLLVRIGGLILATIGAQMALGGLKSFFAA